MVGHFEQLCFGMVLLSVIEVYCDCNLPIDGQCIEPNCYLNDGDECYNCARCTKAQLRNPSQYFRPECREYPYFCMEQYNQNIPESDFPRGFPPISIPEPNTVFTENSGKWLLTVYQEDYPTVSKLCMKEVGNVPEEWTTFQKTRVNITGSDGTRYDRLEEVKNHSYNQSQPTVCFLTASYTGSDNRSKSALSWFNLTVLKRIFQSRRYLDTELQQLVDEEDLPRTRSGAVAGYCSSDRPASDKEKSFLREFPQMFDNVITSPGIASGGSGFLFEGGGLFRTFVTTEKRAVDGKYYKVVYVGTDDGRLFKLAINDDMSSTVLEEHYLTVESTIGISDITLVYSNPLYPVRMLKIITSDGQSKVLSTERCSDITEQCICQQDPFCYWYREAGRCQLFEWKNRNEVVPAPEKQCEGFLETFSPNTALSVIDPFERRVIPTTPAEITGTSKDPLAQQPMDGGKVFQSTKTTGTPKTKPATWITLVVAVVILLVVSVILWKVCQRRSGYGSVPGDEEWKRNWTSISLPRNACCRGNVWLEDPNNGRNHGIVENGRIFFRDLTPSTDYQFYYNDKQVRRRTSGPAFSGHVTEKNSYSVEVADWTNKLMDVRISLRNSKTGFRKTKDVSGSSFNISPLPPNMMFEVYVELIKKDGREFVCEKLIKNIETHSEDFWIDREAGRLCWDKDSLSQGIQTIYISCCQCVFQTPVESPTAAGYVDLPPLPWGVECTFKVAAKYYNSKEEEFEHVIGTVVYETPEIRVIEKRPADKKQDGAEGTSYDEVIINGATLPLNPSDDSGFNSTTSRILVDQEPGSHDAGDDKIRSAPTPLTVYQEPGSHDAGDDFKIQSTPTPLTISIPSSDLQNVAMYLKDSVPSGGSVMLGNYNTNISNCSVNINPAPVISYQSQRSLHSSRPIGPLKSSESFVSIGDTESSDRQCSRTLSQVYELDVKDRHQICQRFQVSKALVEVLCELLEYPPLEQEIYWNAIQRQSIDPLQPLMDRETQLKEVKLSVLLVKLMEYLQTIVNDEQNKDIERFLWLVEYLVSKLHKDECRVCNVICRSCKHLVECR